MEEAKKLIENLKRFQHNGYEPLMVFVFDKASSLLKLDCSGNLDLGLYHTLNQIISCLKLFPIWFFFLSMESQVRMLMPANDEERTGDYSYDPSARMAIPSNNSLERFSPFLAFQLETSETGKGCSAQHIGLRNSARVWTNLRRPSTWRCLYYI